MALPFSTLNKTAMGKPMDTDTTFAPGLHILMDLYGATGLRDKAALRDALTGAAQAAGATVLSCKLHGFGGEGGVTGVALLAESHISIHTWPEYDYAAVDIFMCGAANPKLAAEYLCAALHPTEISMTEIVRGSRKPSGPSI